MDFRLTEEQELLRRTVREFAEREIRPHVMAWDEAQQFPIDLVPARGARPDGHSVSPSATAAPACRPSTTASASKSWRGSIRRSRSRWPRTTGSARRTSPCSAPEQKQQYLPPLARGEKIGAWGLTEAGAGQRRRRHADDGRRAVGCWVLNGSKTFITHGRVGGVMVVMAVTDRGKGHRGISAFVVEQGTPGMPPARRKNKLGMRASDTSEVLFENCRVPGGTCSARRAGVHQHAAGARRRPHRHRGALGRPGAGRLRSGPKYAKDRAAVRPADRELPGDPVEAGRQRDAHRGGAAADLSRGLGRTAARRTTRESSMAKLYASEIAVQGGRRLRADPRRLRLREGLSRPRNSSAT